MSDNGWKDVVVNYEPADFYSSADALDSAPLLGAALGDVQLSQEDDVPEDVQRDPRYHCHWHRLQKNDGSKKLMFAFLFTAVFMVFELIGGYLADSLAVMSDAAHLLSDCLGFGLGLLAFTLAAKPPRGNSTYGHVRAEVLGALTSILLIWVLTGIFMYMAVTRLYSDTYDIRPDTMLVVSGVGIIVNVVIATILRGVPGVHLHSHGQSAQSNPEESDCHQSRRGCRRGDMAGSEAVSPSLDPGRVSRHHLRQNINLRAAFIHAVGDIIQSVGVFVAAIVIKLNPSWKMVDPLCTFLFSAVVLCTTCHVVREAVQLVMQDVPPGYNYRDTRLALERVRGVKSVHSLHAWGLTTDKVVLTAHIVIEDYGDYEVILCQCIELARRYGAYLATFQLEKQKQTMDGCRTCADTGTPLEQP